jgi:hypothetical protein
MTPSEANRQRVLALLIAEDGQMGAEFNAMCKRDPAVRREKPPMSEIRQFSFLDRRDRKPAWILG